MPDLHFYLDYQSDSRDPVVSILDAVLTVSPKKAVSRHLGADHAGNNWSSVNPDPELQGI